MLENHVRIRLKTGVRLLAYLDVEEFLTLGSCSARIPLQTDCQVHEELKVSEKQNKQKSPVPLKAK